VATLASPEAVAPASRRRQHQPVVQAMHLVGRLPVAAAAAAAANETDTVNDGRRPDKTGLAAAAAAAVQLVAFLAAAAVQRAATKVAAMTLHPFVESFFASWRSSGKEDEKDPELKFRKNVCGGRLGHE